MEPHEFEWYGGRVVHWDLGTILPEKPIGLQYRELKEDLAQVQYDGVTLDVGWYPEFSPDGTFVVLVVREGNWEEPLGRFQCRDVPQLYETMRLAIALAHERAG